MKAVKMLMAASVTMSLLACATETRVVHDRSASTKFASMFGGQASTGGEASGAFSMQRGGPPETVQGPQGPVSAQAMEIARILREGAGRQAPLRENPGNVKVITSFQTDDGNGRGNQLMNPNNAPPPAAPAGNPPVPVWGGTAAPR